MKILGLDIASISTGYCIFNNGRLVKSSCGLIRPNPKKTYGERLLYFESEVRSLIHKHKPDTVIIEDIFKGRNILTFKVLAMFRGVAIKVIFEETNTNPISVMASEARSFIGIKNSKEAAFEFIVNKYNLSDFKFETDNDIVDSIVLGLTAHTMHKKGISEKSLRAARRKKRKSRKRKK